MRLFGHKEMPYPEVPDVQTASGNATPLDVPTFIRFSERATAPVEFGTKPEDLERAADTEWTRREWELRKLLGAQSEPEPEPTGEPWSHVTVAEPDPDPAPLVVPWQRAAPTVAGVWWWVADGSNVVRLDVVLDWGGRLCVRQRRGDACMYLSVGSLRRRWAGPVAVPCGLALEEIDP